MGNKIARTTQVSASEYYLHDLPTAHNVVLKEILGRGRFFKSILCKHDEGLVVVKVYFKRGDPIDLREYERRLVHIKDTFRALDHPHVWPFQFWQETDKAAYLIRQYFFSNLHDRLSTRPFLSLVEKKWLALQLLLAVKQCHDQGIFHGDIKCENVLVTSWNWVYLADFASFKPTYIPYDDPSDFSFFFDTGGRRLCYLAPERFYEHGGEMQVAQYAPLKPSMDIFSVGCVIAELFLEGQQLFELSQLLAYRRGQYDPGPHLEKIPDPGIRQMVFHMIQLEPEARLSSELYLRNFAEAVFPRYFSPFLHNFYCCWNPLHSDTRVAMCQSGFHEILKHIVNIPTSEKESPKLYAEEFSFSENLMNHETSDTYLYQRNLLDVIGGLLGAVRTSDDVGALENNTSLEFNICNVKSSNELLQTISNAFRKNGHPFLKNVTVEDLNMLTAEYDSQSDTYGVPFVPLPKPIIKGDGMVLIASLLCSCIRTVKLPHLRREAILLLKASALYVDDEARLQRVIPCVIAMLSDAAAIVRCAALETLCDILPMIRDFSPSDGNIFPEYILPMLSTFPDDSEESVRICYASNISKLALTAYGFLIHMTNLSEAIVLDEQKLSVTSTEGPRISKQACNVEQLRKLRKSISEVVHELVMGPKQTPSIRRALLQDIGNLCYFFGQKQSNDFLLPILPAFLNDRDEQLRALFYGNIVYVCFFVGQRSVEEYLLPYIDQALCDQSEAVIVNAFDCLTILCRNKFLRKRVLLEIIERAFPLLCFPSQWVRRSAVIFIAESSKSLGSVDSYVFLTPLVTPFLCRRPSSLSSVNPILSCLKPPVSRQLFYQLFLENTRSSDMLERQRKIWYNSPTTNIEITEALKGKSSDQSDTVNLERKKNVSDAIIRDADKQSGSTSVGNNDAFDSRSSDKVQGSGYMSFPGNEGGSFMHDRSPDGIPLYSFTMDRRTVRNSPAASDSSLRLNSLGLNSSFMPWMDPLNKSFSLASSVPAPRHISGSFSITGGSKQFYRVVHEPDSRDSDMVQSKANYFSLDDVDQVTVSSFPKVLAVPDSGWKPRGVLVAHLQEHRAAVNDIAVSVDHSFFVTASNDSTIKVWDSRRLEKDISFRSRLSYHLEGSRAMCCVMVRDSHQVVVGASDGILHLFSVDHVSRGLGNVVEKYSSIGDIKRKDIREGAVRNIINYSSNEVPTEAVMYSTQNGGIHLWDARENANSWTLKAVGEEGYVSSMVASPCGNWFVTGSSRGVITLWDLRFLLPVNKWHYSLVCPVEKMCLFVPSNGALSASSRPLVYVAAGSNEVSLWNAENGSCHQVLKAKNCGSDSEGIDAGHMKRGSSKVVNSKYKVEEVNEPPPRLPGIRAMLPLPGGDLLTSGSDLRIRRWDHNRPERSYCVCGPNVNSEDTFETRSSYGVQVVQETKRSHGPIGKMTTKTLLAAAATDAAGCHRDSIVSLASVKLNQRLLISASRDAAIKVWK